MDRSDSASSNGQLVFFVNVEDVLGQPGWRASGFPYCGDFTLTKITEYKPLYKLRYTIVDLGTLPYILKLRFSPGADLKTDLQRVVIPGDWQSFQKSKDFHDDVLAPQGRGIFTGR